MTEARHMNILSERAVVTCFAFFLSSYLDLPEVEQEVIRLNIFMLLSSTKLFSPAALASVLPSTATDLMTLILSH